MYDVVIIGAGVIGCAAAYSLSHYDLKVVVLEKGGDVALGASGANSGIVHAGYDPPPGTLMAGLNVRGNALFPQLCKSLGVPFQACGSLVVAEAAQEGALQNLLSRGNANGVSGLAILGKKELKEREPNLNPRFDRALFAPSAGVTSPWDLTLALAETASVNGVEFRFNAEVTGFRTKADSLKAIEIGTERIEALVVINAAGIYADQLANLAGAERYDIQPRKGEYIVLDKELAGFVHHVIFPLPKKQSKGILLLPTVEGNLLVGPTAVDTATRDDVSTTGEGMAEICREGKMLAPTLPLDKAITSYAGLRAVPKDGDFVLRASAKVRGWIDAGGIHSPGLTAAPAIGEKLARLVGAFIPMVPKARFNPRPPLERFAEKNWGEKQRLIQDNPRYGRIICRCEEVSEGEIIEACQRPVPPTTLDSLKRRLRVASGRCQGGFCLPRLLDLFAKELGVLPETVTKSGPGSEVVVQPLVKGGS